MATSPISSSSPTARAIPAGSRWRILAAVGLVLIAIPAYILFMDVPFLRATGLVAFALMVMGAGYGVHIARKDRRLGVRLAAGLNVLLLAGFVWAFFGLSALPEPGTEADALTTAPPFTLPDQKNEYVSLDSVTSRGPALLVFYRGHW